MNVIILFIRRNYSTKPNKVVYLLIKNPKSLMYLTFEYTFSNQKNVDNISVNFFPKKYAYKFMVS